MKKKNTKFYIKNGKLVSDLFPEGVNNLCAIVDVKTGLMKYGEECHLRDYYSKLLDMYSKLNKVQGDNSDELILIKLDDINIDIEEKAKFMNYMIEYSANGEKIKELLEGSISNLRKWIDNLKC